MFLLFRRNLSDKNGKQLLDATPETGLDPVKTGSKLVAHIADEATGEFVGNKTADKIVKPKPVPEAKSRNVEEIVLPPEKRKEIPKESS